jgi:hypothetical protein
MSCANGEEELSVHGENSGRTDLNVRRTERFGVILCSAMTLQHYFSSPSPLFEHFDGRHFSSLRKQNAPMTLPRKVCHPTPTRCTTADAFPQKGTPVTWAW